jgi:hypothetical protein
VTLTVTATGQAPIRLGTVRVTAPGFQVAADGCSRARLAPGERCTITLRWSVPRARGRRAGSLIVPVGGTRPAEVRLEGTAR